MNLFALRATNPKELLGGIDTVGPDNNRTLAEEMVPAHRIVLAWGASLCSSMRFLMQAEYVERLAGIANYRERVRHLGLTKSGQPKHPLYLSADTALRCLEER